MSTRSAIIIEEADGTASGIYCHFDGYLDHHKPILLGHYQDEAKVRKLISLGDISCLAEEIGEKHPFEYYDRNPRWVSSYGRDRGETGTDARLGTSWSLVAANIGHNGYVYLFRVSEGKWYVQCHNRPLRELSLTKSDFEEREGE